MSYRILRITNFYEEYLNAYYQGFPDIHKSNYIEQYNHLINDSVEIVSSYSKNLRKLGVDAFDIVSNAHILQKTWAKENNIPQYISKQELIFKQIKHYKPDIVWIDDSLLMNKNWLKYLRTEIPSIKLIVGHICAPYNSEIANSFTSFDIMFTCTPCLKKEISSYGVSTQLLYHAFDNSILDLIKKDAEILESDFVFTGSLYTGYGFHKKRIEYIEKMIDNGIDISIYGNLESQSKIRLKRWGYHTINFLRNIKCDFLIEGIPVTKKHKNYGEEDVRYYSKNLINSVKPPIFGLEMLKMLSKSKVCFNIHGEIAKKCAGNVRLFEATGVGTCLVTDWKENLDQLFELEKEVVTYKTINECIEKVSWLLNNPSEASKIAKTGQVRTLKDHTIMNRATIINAVFKKELQK